MQNQLKSCFFTIDIYKKYGCIQLVILTYAIIKYNEEPNIKCHVIGNKKVGKVEK
jgi:hypothetical protein